MRALITGANGFAGSHLVDYLDAHTDWEIVAWVRTGKRNGKPRSQGRVSIVTGDLLDAEGVRERLEQTAPDFLFHLAAIASVRDSWRDPWRVLENNIRAQLNLLEGVRKAGLTPRILVVGSNEEYGLVRPEELPLTEESPLRPHSPYGVSKVTQDMMGLQYHLSYGLPIIRVRPFNHIGPRQRLGFVAPDFARQIAEIEAGLRPPVMRVGNLEARRDFTDVRDVVRAYHLAITHGEPGEVYNIGSGRSRSIRELLETLLSYSTVEVAVELDPARMRPSDIPEIRCDAGRLRARTGWEPHIPFEQSLRDVLDDWRNRIASEV